MIHRVHAYARDVLRGRIVVGPLVALACERHERDRRAKGFTFDPAAANHVIDFIEQWCRLPDTADEYGDPRVFHLEPWQTFIVGSLFGWILPSGHRRFRNAYIEVGKGNGKTPLLAAIGLYGLTSDGQIAPQIYAAAADRAQAMLIYRNGVRRVDASPALAKEMDKSGCQARHTVACGRRVFRPFAREQSA